MTVPFLITRSYDIRSLLLSEGHCGSGARNATTSTAIYTLAARRGGEPAKAPSQERDGHGDAGRQGGGGHGRGDGDRAGGVDRPGGGGRRGRRQRLRRQRGRARSLQRAGQRGGGHHHQGG